MYDFSFSHCKMLVTDITSKKFATDNNGNVCKDKDYSNMQMEKKVKKALPAKCLHGNHSGMSQRPLRTWTQPRRHGKETYDHLQIFPNC